MDQKLSRTGEGGERPLFGSARGFGLLEQDKYLSRIRVASRLPLREDEHAITRDLEDATASLQQVDLRTWVPGADLGRQTGGPGFVVSDDAITDGDMHRRRSGGTALRRRFQSKDAIDSSGNRYAGEIGEPTNHRVLSGHDPAEGIELLLHVCRGLPKLGHHVTDLDQSLGDLQVLLAGG